MTPQIKAARSVSTPAPNIPAPTATPLSQCVSHRGRSRASRRNVARREPLFGVMPDGVEFQNDDRKHGVPNTTSKSELNRKAKRPTRFDWLPLISFMAAAIVASGVLAISDHLGSTRTQTPYDGSAYQTRAEGLPTAAIPQSAPLPETLRAGLLPAPEVAPNVKPTRTTSRSDFTRTQKPAVRKRGAVASSERSKVRHSSAREEDKYSYENPPYPMDLPLPPLEPAQTALPPDHSTRVESPPILITDPTLFAGPE
jgi:hypothetical protein